MKVRLDRARCTGHGRCYALAPEVFEADDEGYGTVLATSVPAGEEDAARRAVANCPEEAIEAEG